MDKKVKEIFMKSVTHGTFNNVQRVFERYKLVYDETFFDYELLKSALERKHLQIVNFLLNHCRVRNPNKVNLEDTVLHLVMKLICTETVREYKFSCNILRKILKNGALIFDKNHDGVTALYAAFKEGYEVAVDIALIHMSTVNNKLLRSNTDSYMKGLNPKDKDNILHFHIACERQHYNVIKLYLRHGFDVNSLSDSIFPGFTVLHSAVKYQREETVKFLLENGTDYTKIDTERNTPLHIAFHNMKLADRCSDKVVQSIMDMLMSKIPQGVNCVNNEGLSYFHIVCTRNDIGMVNDFLRSGVVIDSCVVSGKYSGYTALHFAVLYNQEAVVEKLLKENAQVNVKENKCQLTPLHLACSVSYRKFRFHEGREIDICFRSGSLDFISNRNSQLNIIKLLIQFGADVEAQDFLGATPLLQTCIIDNEMYKDCINPALEAEINETTKEIVNILLLNKANINVCTNCQELILYPNGKILSHLGISCSSGPESILHKIVLKQFIRLKVDMNAVNDAGLTPLHIAVQSAKKELVQIFLKHKADVNVKSKNSLIPLHFALNNYYKFGMVGKNVEKDILCALLEEESNVNLIYENKKTPLQKALMECNCFIIEKLLCYGADMNIEDSSGNMLLFSLLQSKYQEDEIVLLSRFNAFKVVFVHVQKLLALGSHVSEKVQTCCNRLLQHYQEVHDQTIPTHNLNRIFDDCVEELNRMKLINISNCTSLYDILQKNVHKLSKQVKNSTLVEILEYQNIDKNFPLYSSLLKIKYKKGLKRSDALQLAKLSLTRIIRLNLPDLCSDLVLQYLTIEEMTNLNAAARGWKRKLQSNDAETSVKFQKKQ